MGKAVAGATVSLDGYIAGPNESGFEHLFAWFAGGDFDFPSVNPDVQFRLTEPDYRYLRDVVEGIGVFVVGRRMFDLSDGWGGRHPFDEPIVVVTHSVPQRWVAAHLDAPSTFVTDGLQSAIERARAPRASQPRSRSTSKRRMRRHAGAAGRSGHRLPRHPSAGDRGTCEPARTDEPMPSPT